MADSQPVENIWNSQPVSGGLRQQAIGAAVENDEAETDQRHAGKFAQCEPFAKEEHAEKDGARRHQQSDERGIAAPAAAMIRK